MSTPRRLIFSLGLLLSALPLSAVELYVSPSGNDTNPGTREKPLATLEAARGGARPPGALAPTAPGPEHRSGSAFPPAEPTTIYLRAGHYRLTRTVTFTAADSGTAAAPIIYSAYPGEAVILSGAAPLDPSWWSPLTSAAPVWSRIDPAARGKIYVADLRAHGLTDWGTLSPRGFSLRAAAPAELFWDGQPMTLARWPNADETVPFVRTRGAVRPDLFYLAGDRPARWKDAKDIWLHGFWSQDWADFHVAVRSVDAATGTVQLAAPPEQYGLKAERPFYAYNLLEELDSPGEYYLDRSTGLLYFWPPGGAAPERWPRVSLSMMDRPLITLQGARYVVFRGLTLEAARGTLVTMSADSSHDTFDDCVLRGAGQAGAQIGGSNNGLTNCEVVACGEEGVRMTGGDRPTLTAGNNFVDHSHLLKTGRIGWTYKPAISFEGGCGNAATNNTIEDLPHAAILFAGNNHLIRSNEIWHVCQLTSDSGAIYAGKSWAYRGNRIEYNYLHDISSALGSSDVNGVYLDDCLSGVTVFANIFYRISGTAIFCGGGRDNLMTNNIIAYCGAAHHDDDRGRREINDRPGDSWNLLESLHADGVNYRSPAWTAAYPECAAIPESYAEIRSGLWRNPQHSIFAHNIGWKNGEWLTEDNPSRTGVYKVYTSLADNHANARPFFDPDSSRPAALNPAFAGFESIPFAAIGR